MWTCQRSSASMQPYLSLNTKLVWNGIVFIPKAPRILLSFVRTDLLTGSGGKTPSWLYRRGWTGLLSRTQAHRLYTDSQASTDFHGCWAEEVHGENRWIARAAVGILREITTIEIKRVDQIPSDPSLPLRLILNHVFYFRTVSLNIIRMIGTRC